jgi:hypothetical protein
MATEDRRRGAKGEKGEREESKKREQRRRKMETEKDIDVNN